MDKIYPVGTIIKLKNRLVMVVGYEFPPVNDKLSLHYAVVPYPEGFVNGEDLRLIPWEIAEVVATGYESKVSELATSFFENIQAVAQHVTAQEMANYLDEVTKKIEGAR